MNPFASLTALIRRYIEETKFSNKFLDCAGISPFSIDNREIFIFYCLFEENIVKKPLTVIKHSFSNQNIYNIKHSDLSPGYNIKCVPI